jgi:SnoaL-like protein
MRRRMPSVVLVVGLALVPPAYGQQTLTAQDRPVSLTAQDRADIQDLTARYARALGACAADEYAELFAPETGYFASNIRGEVVGRVRLIALVRSERHCTNPPSSSSNPAAQSRPVPTVTIESTAAGVTGRADLGAAGRYEDEYVKTAKGWRFKSRTVMTPPEVNAGLTAQDVRAIRRLAGTDLGQFDDVYVAGADGVKRFRASGVATGVSPEGITGRAYLKSGGHYDDVYVKTPDGGWRFKSRVYVADAAPGASTPPSSPGVVR